MKATEQTLQEVDRAIRKVAEKFPSSEEATMLTDIHLRVSQDSGELLAYDDDDNEINRCVVDYSTFISTWTPLGSSSFISASTVLAVLL